MSIFGNGDVLSYEDYEASVEKSGVDGSVKILFDNLLRLYVANSQRIEWPMLQEL